MPIEFIPTSFHRGTPHSERLVAEWLKADPRASGFTVYHSHGLGAHERKRGPRNSQGKKPHGEIDFVVLVPPAGIVTVEVKGDEISRAKGQWHQRGNGYSHDIDDPTAQMVNNQHKFLQDLQRRLDRKEDQRALRVAGLVLFPKTEHCPPAEDLECNAWEVVSYAEYNEFGIAGCIERALKGTTEAIGGRKGPPPPGLMNRVKSVLRRDFDLPVSSLAMREEENRKRIELTEQQYQFLSVVDANDRALVTGGAGTGKTLLALEFAKRELLNGRDIALFCFNNLLGAWLERQAQNLRSSLAEEKPGEIYAGTYQSWLLKMVKKDAAVRKLYEDEVLRRGNEERWRILDECAGLALHDVGAQFDTVIIDEVQDFQNPAWIPLIDESLKGGLRDGRWAMFGDYSRQALYSSADNPMRTQDFLDALSGYGAYPTRMPLSVNCRNTKRIADMTAALTGFDEKPYNVLGFEGKRVDRLYYRSPEEEFAKIKQARDGYLSDDISFEEIVLLWDAQGVRDGFLEAAKKSGLKLTQWGDALAKHGDILSSSIQRFKGLEADAVIVCNIHAISEEALQQKLYVAMSRPRSRLTLVLPHTLRATVDNLMAKHFGEN